MTDFPSIQDLTKKPAAPGKGPLDTTSAQAKFSQKMTQLGLKEKEKEVADKAAALGMPYIDLAGFPVSAEALKTIPEEQAKEKKLVCFLFNGDELRLGTVEKTPETDELAFQIAERHHAHTVVYLISQESLEHVLKLYANLPIVKPITKDINITDEELNKFSAEIKNLKSIQEKFGSISISDILTLMIAAALKVNSSDIHVEAEEKGVAVRYRIDGILQNIAMLPKEDWKKFISRIKLLAALKINIDDKPQDGRVTLRLSSGNLDIRVSTMPTVYGESVVMRILHSGSKGVTFDELGLRGEAFERLKREVERPNGMIITTGPTGSGKTTTLYGILRTLNKPGVKIITLEDPVEIKMEGINQSQVDPSHDYTFAKGLRSILRAGVIGESK